MSAGTYDFVIEQGATLSLDINYLDSNGDLFDLTSGYTAAMKIKDTVGGVTIASLTNGSGITFHSVATSTPNINITIAHTVTSGYSFSDAVYDFELTTTGTSTVARLFQGKVTLSENVTA